MKLKVYADRMSQPSRAVILFCKLNGIDYEEVKVDISKRQHLTPEFAEINPMQLVPAIVDGRFKLFESHAILIYLACAFPGVADHWYVHGSVFYDINMITFEEFYNVTSLCADVYVLYPADVYKRSELHSVLDWHHTNLRRGPVDYVLSTTLGPVLGRPLNPEAAVEAEKFLSSSLTKIESIWLKDNRRFLLGGNQPSIADLSLVCDIMQLEVLDEKDHNRLLGPYKKVQQWIENTRNATQPHFDEVHKILMKVKEKFRNQQLNDANNGGGSSMKKLLLSRM